MATTVVNRGHQWRSSCNIAGIHISGWPSLQIDKKTHRIGHQKGGRRCRNLHFPDREVHYPVLPLEFEQPCSKEVRVCQMHKGLAFIIIILAPYAASLGPACGRQAWWLACNLKQLEGHVDPSMNEWQR